MSSSPKLLWSFEIHNVGLSPAIGQDGTVHFAADDSPWVYALGKDGKQLWRCSYDPKPYQRDVAYYGARIICSPAGNLILACRVTSKQNADWLGHATRVAAISRKGELLWQTTFKSHNDLLALAQSRDGTIYVCPPGKQLHALDANGKLKWSFEAKDEFCTLPRVGADGTIYVGTQDARVHAITPEGQSKWVFPLGGIGMCDFSLGGNGCICLHNHYGEVIVLDASGSELLRTSEIGTGPGRHAPLVLADGTLVVVSKDAVRAVKPDGQIKWAYALPEAATPPLPDPVAPSTMVAARDGTVIIAPNSEAEESPSPSQVRILAIGSKGEEAWEFKVDARGWPTCIANLALDATGILYAVTAQSLHAIHIPTGLMESPWPMDCQNPQRTGQASSAFVTAVAYQSSNRTAKLPDPRLTIFPGSNETPRLLWAYQTTSSGRPPAVGRDGTVYFGTDDDPHVYALGPDGRRKWRYCYDPYFRNGCGVAVAVAQSGHLILDCHVHHAEAEFGAGRKLVILNDSGELQWEKLFKEAYHVGGSDQAQAEMPDGTIVYAPTGKKVYAFDPDGKRLWECKVAGKVCISPRVSSDGTVYVGASDKRIYAINSDGTKKWEFFVGGAELFDFSVGTGGDLVVATFDCELVILDVDGRVRVRGVRVVSDHPPLICPDGTIVSCSSWEKRICATGPNGKTKWSHAVDCEECSFSSGVLAADGSTLVHPQIKTGPLTNKGDVVAIGADGQKVWELPLKGHATRGLTLTPEGILYVFTCEALYAIQCSIGLADAPWPMDSQNPQRTSCANPKFSQPIAYGAASSSVAHPVEISSATPSKPLPEKPFTKQEVLQQLDSTPDFPMLDNGFVYPATARLSAYRDAAGLRWALVIEVVGWDNHGSDHQAIQNALYCFGNWLNIPPGLTNDGFLHMTRDGEESSTFDDQDVDPETRTLYVREKLVRIPRTRKRYKELGIELEESGVIKGYELLRALVAEHRDLFLATEEELRQRVPADLSLVLRLDEWRHPQVGNEKPSQTETFQMIAEMLATGDPKRYRPTAKPNTHWKHWPMGGQL